MADRRSILANLSALAAGQAIAMALGLVTHAILARALGPADYGILGFAVAVMSYFGIAASLGTDMWAMREIATERSRVREIVGAVVSLRFALCIVALAAVAILAAAWDRPPPVGTVVLIQAASLFIAALTLDFAFQGLERLDAVARRQVTTALIALAGVAAALGLGGGVAAAAAVLQAAAFAAVVAMWGEFAVLAGWPRFGRPSGVRWRRIVRESAPLAVTGLVVTVYTYIDVVMLGFLRPSEEVGLYVAAMRIMMIGLAAIAVFRTAFSPVLARLMGEPAARREAGHHHASAVAATGAWGALVGFALAPEILAAIYGETFAPAAAALRVLMANLLFACAVEVCHTQLVAWRLQTQQMWIMVAGAALNVALNFALIPHYGIEGAAAATLVSTLIVWILAAATLRRRGYEIHVEAMWRAGVLAAILAGLGVLAIGQLALDSAVVRIVVGGAILSVLYGGAVWLTGALRPGETLGYFNRRA